ncbi:MAG: Smr/MutS family protein [Desulfovibrionaceae bacterium]|nr:Smr/MutS family protein [Desulfovibrionaceae bacterium]
MALFAGAMSGVARLERGSARGKGARAKPRPEDPGFPLHQAAEGYAALNKALGKPAPGQGPEPDPEQDTGAETRTNEASEAAPAAPGGSIAPAQPSPAAASPVPETAPAPPTPEEDAAFARAMAGVAPLAGSGRAVDAQAPLPEITPPPADAAARERLREFMEGKVEFDLQNTAEYIQGHVKGFDPKTMGQLRAGRISHEAHLDLHGLNAVQAYEGLVDFMKKRYMEGRRCVLLIPGRGLGSPDGYGVLREKLQSWLTQDPFKRVVLAFCTALPRDGGAGALYVMLRKHKKSRGKIQWDRTPSDPDLF